MRRQDARRSPGPAVLRFFICLLILIVIALLAVFFLRRGNSGDGRPYIATGTGAPPTIPPTAEPATESTPEAVITAEPTAEITSEPTPEPTPTPAPTPDPTNIPESALSVVRKKFSLPDPSDDGSAGVSACYVSAIDNYSIMEVTGWGYADVEQFDGTQCGTYLIVTQQNSGASIAYLAVNSEGISGREHMTSACKNAAVSDWRAYIDVSAYEPGMYNLGVVLCFKEGDKDVYRYYKLGDLQSFTVKDGEVITPVTVTSGI